MPAADALPAEVRLIAIPCPACKRLGTLRYVRTSKQYQRVVGAREDGVLIVAPEVDRFDGAADAHHLVCVDCWQTWPVDVPVLIPQPWNLEAAR